MKLKDRRRTPVGGFYYDDPILNRRISTDSNFNRLLSAVESMYRANAIEIPGNLDLLIEDQICMRQPDDRCYYTKGLGDRLSKAIHAVAGGIDKVVGTNLKKKARGCGGCGKRRMKLNSR